MDGMVRREIGVRERGAGCVPQANPPAALPGAVPRAATGGAAGGRSPCVHPRSSTTSAFAPGPGFGEAGEGNQLRDFLELNSCSLPWRRITFNPVEVPGSARFWTREGG